MLNGKVNRANTLASVTLVRMCGIINEGSVQFSAEFGHSPWQSNRMKFLQVSKVGNVKLEKSF